MWKNQQYFFPILSATQIKFLNSIHSKFRLKPESIDWMPLNLLILYLVVDFVWGLFKPYWEFISHIPGERGDKYPARGSTPCSIEEECDTWKFYSIGYPSNWGNRWHITTNLGRKRVASQAFNAWNLWDVFILLKPENLSRSLLLRDIFLSSHHSSFLMAKNVSLEGKQNCSNFFKKFFLFRYFIFIFQAGNPRMQ